ncbi:hypothetical protein CJ20_296 [Escherichia phage CJ20]|nr:hypothetical protein CJ20_296 [Escherichia phage CJ20]
MTGFPVSDSFKPILNNIRLIIVVNHITFADMLKPRFIKIIKSHGCTSRYNLLANALRAFDSFSLVSGNASIYSAIISVKRFMSNSSSESVVSTLLSTLLTTRNSCTRFSNSDSNLVRSLSTFSTITRTDKSLKSS